MNSLVRELALDRDVSGDEFRGAMRALVGGVSIITVGRGRDISGMTVTSVSSLSVEPATLIVSINRSSSSWPLLAKHRVFGVSLPSADQVAVAERFAGKGGLKGADRFTGADWTTRVTGVPLLQGALASIDCEVEELIERHSHAIVIGRVLDIDVASSGAGLGYWRGDYVGIDRDENAVRLAQPVIPASRRLREI